jgi:hypothetical protein
MEITALSRRDLLWYGSAALASSGRVSGAPPAATKPQTVHDCLWLWSHVAGSYNGMFGLPGKSRMTPAEAAFYMGIPNVFMLHREGTPEPPLEQFALAFEPLRDVVWGIVGDSGTTNEKEREMVLNLALHTPKISGVVMDDFFRKPKDGQVSALTLDQVREMKQRLHPSGKRLDLWVVLYEHQLDQPLTEYLALCDYVQLWTWYGQNLTGLRTNFEKARKLSSGAKMALGIYWWDFGNQKPLTMDLMKSQCETALQLLKQGQVEALVFCGSWLCDRGLETVAWTRKWIQDVGRERLQRA